MPPRLSNPVAVTFDQHPLAIAAALAATSAACGFAAIAIGAYSGHPAQWIATTTFALFGAGAGAVCAAVQAAFDHRAASRWARGGTAATPGAPHLTPAPAALQPAPAGEAAQPA